MAARAGGALPRLAARQMQATLQRAVCAASQSKNFAGAAQSESLRRDAPLRLLVRSYNTGTPARRDLHCDASHAFIARARAATGAAACVESAAA